MAWNPTEAVIIALVIIVSDSLRANPLQWRTRVLMNSAWLVFRC